MAWPSLLHRLFQSNGAGDTLRSEVIPRVIPAGTVATFAGKNAPDGWLIADGRAVSRSQYSDLYNAIGTLYGNGDGSSTFNLPNLTHNYVRPTATPSEVGITLAPGLPNITAGLEAKGAIAWQGDVGAFHLSGSPADQASAASNTNDGRPSTTLSFDASRSNAIYGRYQNQQVIPQSIHLLGIIKA